MTRPPANPDDAEWCAETHSSRIPFWLGLLYSFICLPPWIPGFLAADGRRDPSWQYALHEAAVQDWEFGTEVIFTYGPYGFLTTQMYHPATFPLMLAAWIALSGLFYLHVNRLAGPASGNPWGALLISATAVRLAAFDAMTFLLSFWVIFLLDKSDSPAANAPEGGESKSRMSIQRSKDWLIRAGLVLAVGLLPLTKFTFVPVGLVVLSAIAVGDVFHRRFPWGTLMALAATVLLWGLSGQPLAGFREYLVGGFELARYYEPAMSLWETEPWDVAAVWCALVLVVSLPFLLRPSELRARRFVESIVPWTLCLLLFLVWKFTFVRFHPQKITIFYSSAALLALLAVLANPARGAAIKRRQLSGLAMALGLLLVAAVVTHLRFPGNSALPVQQLVWANPQSPAAVKAFVQGDEWMAERHRDIREAIRRQRDLSRSTGTIDVFPDQLSLALTGRDLEFRARPVMQSYSAYSPWLQERNAAHYRSLRAPERVLFRVDVLDNHFPTLCDALAWRELLQRYELEADLGKNLLLQRLSNPRRLQVAKRGQAEGKWNRWIVLPESDNGLIWCRVKLSQKPLGQLASFAYKQPHVLLEVQGREPQARRFHFIPAAGMSGFLLSPAVLTKEDFARLLSGDQTPGRSEVLAIRFLLSQDGLREWLYEDSISVEFDQLTLRTREKITPVFPVPHPALSLPSPPRGEGT